MDLASRSAVVLAHNDVVAQTNLIARVCSAVIHGNGILGDCVEGVAAHRRGISFRFIGFCYSGHTQKCLTTQAQRPGPREAWIATVTRWPGSLQRIDDMRGIRWAWFTGSMVEEKQHQQRGGALATDGNRSSQPLSKSSQSLSKSSQPLSKSSQPLSKSSQPLSKSSQPLTKSSQPLTKSSQSLSKSSQPLSKSSQSLNKSSQSLNKSS